MTNRFIRDLRFVAIKFLFSALFIKRAAIGSLFLPTDSLSRWDYTCPGGQCQGSYRSKAEWRMAAVTELIHD